MADDVASSSGDAPATSAAAGSAAAASKAEAAVVQLARTAQCSGVPPTASRAFGAAPASNSASTTLYPPAYALSPFTPLTPVGVQRRNAGVNA